MVRMCSAAFAAFVIMVGFAQVASADQTAGFKTDSAQPWDGYRGVHNIRTNPNAVTGVAFVHAEQVDVGQVGGDFFAIGTAKGVGVDACANNYSNPWNVYTDGVAFGVYFCSDVTGAGYFTAGDNPGFSLTYGFCPSQSANRWLFSFSGTVWQCRSNSANSASRIISMLETVGSDAVTDRNIDIKHNQLEYNLTSGTTWTSFGNAWSNSVDPSYTATHPDATSVYTYLSPLD